jgi:hypothetical protein
MGYRLSPPAGACDEHSFGLDEAEGMLDERFSGSHPSEGAVAPQAPKGASDEHGVALDEAKGMLYEQLSVWHPYEGAVVAQAPKGRQVVADGVSHREAEPNGF